MITHSALVTEVRLKEKQIQVKIEQTSACAQCSSKKYCGMSEHKDTLVDVPCDDSENYEKGEEVEVIFSESGGMTAVFWAYVLPFLLLILTAFSSYKLSEGNELLTGLLTIAVVGVYYILLRCLASRLERRFHFKVRKKNHTFANSRGETE